MNEAEREFDDDSPLMTPVRPAPREQADAFRGVIPFVPREPESKAAQRTPGTLSATIRHWLKLKP